MHYFQQVPPLVIAALFVLVVVVLEEEEEEEEEEAILHCCLLRDPFISQALQGQQIMGVPVTPSIACVMTGIIVHSCPHFDWDRGSAQPCCSVQLLRADLLTPLCLQDATHSLSSPAPTAPRAHLPLNASDFPSTAAAPLSASDLPSPAATTLWTTGRRNTCETRQQPQQPALQRRFEAVCLGFVSEPSVMPCAGNRAWPPCPSTLNRMWCVAAAFGCRCEKVSHFGAGSHRRLSHHHVLEPTRSREAVCALSRVPPQVQRAADPAV